MRIKSFWDWVAMAPEGQEGSETVTEASPEPQVDVDPTPDPTPAPEPPKVPAWQTRRIDEITKARREAERRAESEAERARVAEERLALLSATLKPGEGESAAPAQQTYSPEALQEAIAAQAELIAEQKLTAQQFNSACNGIFDAGTKEFGAKEFPTVVGNLRQLVTGDPKAEQRYSAMLEAVTTVDNGHRVIKALSDDLDEASRILDLPPVKMAVEIAKLGLKVNAPKPTSSAPPPPKPVRGSAAATTQQDPEKMTMQEYAAWRAEQRKARRR